MNTNDYDLKLLGPLFSLVGKWKGVKGRNVAPDPARGIEDGFYTEELSFTAIKTVKNHEQTLYGLRYFKVALENGLEPFHEETGYLLWEPEAKEVYKGFMVPRGITVLAGGKAESNSAKFTLEAKIGDSSFGIASTPFLNREFKTVRYTVDLEILSSNEFSYKEITFMQMPGRKELFEHLDQNLLTRVE